MRVLITGGCGFLGSNLGAAYLRQGAEVTVVDALFRAGSEQNLAWLQKQAPSDACLHFARGDLADSELVDGVFQRRGPFDFVCHVGGQVAMTTSLKDPRRDLMTNVLGTFNVLDAVRRRSPDAIVAFSSTNKVYGDLEALQYSETATRYVVADFPHGFDESLPLDFSTPYGCSKGSADQYVRDWYRTYGIKTVVFRHSSIYGGRQFATYDQGWVGWFCEQALRQEAARADGSKVEPFTISGTGKQVRDVLHAEDLVRLYQSAYERRAVAAGQIFNIGGGMVNSLSLLELFQLLERLLALAEPLAFARLARRQSDQNVFVADVRKAAELLQWRPQVSSADGIDAMLEWARQTA